MKPLRFAKNLTVLMISFALLAGCSETTELTVPTEIVQTTARTTMLDSAVIDYDVAKSKPSIMVDLVGYLPDVDKKAVFSGAGLPSSFRVVDSDGVQVFKGDIKVVSDPEDEGTVFGVGDFSDLTEDGVYHIEADYLGSSEDFEIKEDIYSELLASSFKSLNALRYNRTDEKLAIENSADTLIDVSGGWLTGEGLERDVVLGCIAAYDLMVAYEYNTRAFSDNAGIKESGNNVPDILDETIFELDWLLKMQNAETGGVYAGIVKDSSGFFYVVSPETTRATVNFCIVMARFSYIINRYDYSFSSKCMKAANRAWKCIEANKDLVSQEQKYRAAVEMYKATGYDVYHNVIADYLNTNSKKDYESRYTLDAAITYMSTGRYLNMEYCTDLMRTFMSRTQSKVALSEADAFFVESVEMSADELLRNTEELAIVDYIISSSEYHKVEENYLHYLCGRNADSEILLDYGNNPGTYAKLLVLLGRLAMV